MYIIHTYNIHTDVIYSIIKMYYPLIYQFKGQLGSDGAGKMQKKIGAFAFFLINTCDASCLCPQHLRGKCVASVFVLLYQ